MKERPSQQEKDKHSTLYEIRELANKKNPKFPNFLEKKSLLISQYEVCELAARQRRENGLQNRGRKGALSICNSESKAELLDIRAKLLHKSIPIRQILIQLPFTPIVQGQATNLTRECLNESLHVLRTKPSHIKRK